MFFGEIDFNDFMSGHNFYYHWFRSFNFDKCSFLNIIFAEELNNIIYETTKNSQNIAQSKEDLRIKISNLLETIDVIEKDVFPLRNCIAYLYSKNEKDYLTIQNDERIISVSTKNISFIESYMKEDLTIWKLR